MYLLHRCKYWKHMESILQTEGVGQKIHTGRIIVKVKPNIRAIFHQSVKGLNNVQKFIVV